MRRVTRETLLHDEVTGTYYVGRCPEQIRLTCDECGQTVETAVRMGQQTGYDDPPTLDVCPDCLRKALALLEPSK